MLPVRSKPLVCYACFRSARRTDLNGGDDEQQAATYFLACVALGLQLATTLAAEPGKASSATGQSEQPKSAKQNEPESQSHNADTPTKRGGANTAEKQRAAKDAQ